MKIGAGFWLDEKTEKVRGPVEAEARAKELIETRHSKVSKIFFKRTYRYGSSWIVEGEFSFGRAYFFTVRKSFKVQIKAETGEVTSYEETRHSTT